MYIPSFFDIIIIDSFNVIFSMKGDNFYSFLKEGINPILARNGKVFVLFDPIPLDDLGLQRSWKRLEIYDDYKGKREIPTDILKKLRKAILQIDNVDPNYLVCQSQGCEADDLIKPIIEKNIDKNILIVSKDEDAYRFLSKNVFVKKGIYGSIYSMFAFEKEYGFTPTMDKVILYKLFFGDKSDNIKGLWNYPLMNRRADKMKSPTLKKMLPDINIIKDYISIFTGEAKKSIGNFISNAPSENEVEEKIRQIIRTYGNSKIHSFIENAYLLYSPMEGVEYEDCVKEYKENPLKTKLMTHRDTPKQAVKRRPFVLAELSI